MSFRPCSQEMLDAWNDPTFQEQYSKVIQAFAERNTTNLKARPAAFNAGCTYTETLQPKPRRNTMQITIKCGTNQATVSTDMLDIEQIGDVLDSSVLQQMFGFGDNIVASINGTEVSRDTYLSEGDTVVLTTKAASKG